MQRTVAIDNIRRNAALTRRLTERRTTPAGVINWREFTSRRTSPAIGMRWSTSPLVASGSRFAVSRATPQHDGLELFAASPHQESHGAAASRPRVQFEMAADHAERPSTATTPAPSNIPATQFRISRRSADAIRPAHRTSAHPASGTRAQNVAPLTRHARTNAAGDLVLSRSPSKTHETAVRRDPASNVSSRRAGNDPHTPAATASRSHGDVASSVTSQSQTLSRKAANVSAARPAPLRSPIGRAHSRVSIARKHLPKGSAFQPRDTLFRSSKSRHGSRAGVETLSDETPRSVLNVAHASPYGKAVAAPAASASADGAYRAADNFVAMPLPEVETRVESNVTGVGLRQRPLTILRSALAFAPVRRVEVRQRAEDASAGEILTRKIAHAPAVEPTEARPLVMRQATPTTSGTHVAPHASPETAASSPTSAAATQSHEIDLARLAEQVSRIISRRLAVERERRGQWK